MPHLPTLMRMGEQNYAACMRLLQDCDEVSLQYRFGIDNGFQFTLQIIDNAPYTTTLLISQAHQHLPEFLRPNMTVRLYHDAREAEVLKVARISRLKPSYDYPNMHMHQRNEKFMTNLFLTEWLDFCLRHKVTVVE